MGKFPLVAALGALSLSLGACGGGGEASGNEAPDELPGQPVNAAVGINAIGDDSGTTGSTTGEAGVTLNIAADAEGDSAEANGAATNTQ